MPVSPTTALPAPFPLSQPDPDFERRWIAWQTRGLAHDRAVRGRFIIVAQIAGVIALAAVGAYVLLS